MTTIQPPLDLFFGLTLTENPDPTWGNQSLGYGFNPHIRCTLKTLKMSMERGRICQDTTRRPANPSALSTVTGRQSSREDLTLENSNFDEEDYDSSTNFGWCSPKCSGIKTQMFEAKMVPFHHHIPLPRRVLAGCHDGVRYLPHVRHVWGKPCVSFIGKLSH